MRIEIDGKLVYNGECKDGMYVRLVDDARIARTAETQNRGVLLDYDEYGRLVGVEILPGGRPEDFLSAVAEARENGLTDETINKTGEVGYYDFSPDE